MDLNATIQSIGMASYIPIKTAEEECRRQILQYNFNVALVPMMILFFSVFSAYALSVNPEKTREIFKNAGINEDMADRIFYGLLEFSLLLMVLYAVYWYLHFIKGWI